MSISSKPWLDLDPQELWLPWFTRSNYGYLLLPTNSSSKDRLSISSRLMLTSSSGWVSPYHRSQHYQWSSFSVSYICSLLSGGHSLLVSSSSWLVCILTSKWLRCKDKLEKVTWKPKTKEWTLPMSCFKISKSSRCILGKIFSWTCFQKDVLPSSRNYLKFRDLVPSVLLYCTSSQL